MSEQPPKNRPRCFIAAVFFLTTLIISPILSVSAFFGSCNAAQTPDSYEPDNAPQQARPTLLYIGFAEDQHHNFHAEGDEDWVEFCALPGEAYEIEGRNVGARSDLGLELYDTDGKTLLAFEYWPNGRGEVVLPWKCERPGSYYVRVTPNDPTLFGEGAEYDLALYIPAQPQGSGALTGFITDALTRKPLPGVTITTSGKASSYYNPKHGDYALNDTVGTYTLNLTARGYKTFKSQIKIPDSQTLRKDFDLIPLKSPDLVITTVSGPARGVAGQSVSVSSTVKNQGKASASTFKVGLYLSKDRTVKPDKDRLIGSYQVKKLAAGASFQAATKITIPTGVTPGAYYLGAVADYSLSVAEAREDNNALASKRTIGISAAGGMIPRASMESKAKEEQP